MMGGMADEFDRVWRPGLGARVTGWLIAGVAGLLALSALATAAGGGIPAGGAVVVALVNAVVAVAAWRWGGHPLLAASAAGLTLRNPLRTIEVPWDDIVGARASSLGITIARASGEPVVAWAVTRSALSAWLGRPSPADDVIAYLAARVVGGQGVDEPALGDEPAGTDGPGAGDETEGRPGVAGAGEERGPGA
jgi:Bacterial PH domain